MKIIRTGQVPKELTHNPIFTGGPVTRQNILTPPVSKSLEVAIVNFSKGARNKFHTHTQDQLLIVTAGKGIVATEQGESVVTVGDIILIPAGEKHWHGATQDSEFSHIYVVTAGNETKIATA